MSTPTRPAGAPAPRNVWNDRNVWNVFAMGNDGNETPFVPTVPIVSIVSFVPIVSTVPTVRNVPIVLFVPAVRIVPIVPNVPFVPYRKNVPVVPFVSGVPDNSPLSLAALTGVSPAPPRGEPSVRASIMVNCTVRQSCEQVCLTTTQRSTVGRALASPGGGGGTGRASGL